MFKNSFRHNEDVFKLLFWNLSPFEDLFRNRNSFENRNFVVCSLSLIHGLQITAKILEATSGSLKLVGRAGTGVDNIDVVAATRHGVIVMNTPGWFNIV